MMNRLIAVMCVLVLFQACTPVGMVMSAGTTTATMAMEERGIEGSFDDYSLKGKIVSKWASSDLSLNADLTAIVYNAKAMIIGDVETEEERARAISLVWQVDGIQDVFNEIRLIGESDLERSARDTWVDTKLSALLMFDGDVLDINYKFDTQRGVVYVIGMAQSRGELNRFIDHAKSIASVRRIISHVEVKPRQSMFRKNYNATPESTPPQPAS